MVSIKLLTAIESLQFSHQKALVKLIVVNYQQQTSISTRQQPKVIKLNPQLDVNKR